MLGPLKVAFFAWYGAANLRTFQLGASAVDRLAAYDYGPAMSYTVLKLRRAQRQTPSAKRITRTARKAPTVGVDID